MKFYVFIEVLFIHFARDLDHFMHFNIENTIGQSKRNLVLETNSDFICMDLIPTL